MERISHLIALGQMLQTSEQWQEKINNARQKNPWFVPQFVKQASDALIAQMLDGIKLNEWVNSYSLTKPVSKTVGLIFAGNVPLVGFHDFLCCYLAGCQIKIKLSSKDDELFSYLLSCLAAIDDEVSKQVEIVPQLKGFDAVIATGSNNTNRYFEYYFRGVPKILRKNRNSVAILQGNESDVDLMKLSDDIFLYFGLGCRNVSKLMVPDGYDITQLFPHFEKKYKWLHEHNVYMNNYDYNRTILMLNKTPHLSNEFVMLTENPSYSSPIAVLHYEYWSNKDKLYKQMESDDGKIQCIVSNNMEKWPLHYTVPFGKAQQPDLSDYADGIDTMQFLVGL